jgi:hypothetical protein
LRDVVILLANDREAVEITGAGQSLNVGDMQRGEGGGQFNDHAPGGQFDV